MNLSAVRLEADLLARRLERLAREVDDMLTLDEPGLNELPEPDEPPEDLMDLEDEE